MTPKLNALVATLTALSAFVTSTTAAVSCNTTALNTTTGLYYISEYGTTILDVANATNRGVCDIGRHNLMADVEIIPNVGQQILIPPEVCEPDNETCILPRQNATRTCIYGGPRLYYIQPYSFTFGVYKDLAEEYGTTIGQIMMMSPRYNYSSIAMMGGTPPPIGPPINCTALSNNVTVLN